MAQDTLYILKKARSKGFAALTTILLAAALATISFIVIQYGRISLNVAFEKQLLDTCSIDVGIAINSTNDIDSMCKSVRLEQCALTFDSQEPSFVCEDLGLECNINNQCKRKLKVTSTYNPGKSYVSKENIIEINEEVQEVDAIDTAVILLLDFSGSMSGNRINQLKTTVRQFVSANYNLSYSVILYNDSIIIESSIGKGNQHKQEVLSILNTHNADGGTNFVAPLTSAVNQISTTNYESYYIVLISDGSPNEGVGPSSEFVQNNIFNINPENCRQTTVQNPCITTYTLGVDNANVDALKSVSGNVLNQNSIDYNYIVNTQQVNGAFSAIIEEIMCKIGPVLAEYPANVFNGLTLLEEDIDYVYNSDEKIFKFYDIEPFYACTEMLNNRAQITLRWGKVELKIEQ